MMTYDTRYLIIVSICSLILFKVSQLKWYQVSFVVKFIAFFTVINVIAVYLFDLNTASAFMVLEQNYGQVLEDLL